MGLDFNPYIFYGFRLIKVRVSDDYLAYCAPEEWRHGNTHIYGIIVNFSDYKSRKPLTGKAKIFGELMLKHFGIKCHHFIVQSGDYICNGCSKISSLSLFRSFKPELNDEQAVKMFNEIYREVHGGTHVWKLEDFESNSDTEEVSEVEGKKLKTDAPEEYLADCPFDDTDNEFNRHEELEFRRDT